MKASQSLGIVLACNYICIVTYYADMAVPEGGGTWLGRLIYFPFVMMNAVGWGLNAHFHLRVFNFYSLSDYAAKLHTILMSYIDEPLHEILAV